MCVGGGGGGGGAAGLIIVRESEFGLREKQQALAAKRADLDKLRTNPAMANPTLAARMQPKIAEREALSLRADGGGGASSLSAQS